MVPTAGQVLFAHVVDRPDDEIDLDVASLLIGEWEYEELDVAHYLSVLDRFAGQVETELATAADEPFADLGAINRVLFDALGFRGNRDEYYDPKNSFLNEVIDRRVGIPITLSVLYMEVGRRVGLDLMGISFPGHFLIRCDRDDDIVILDPFHLGMTLDEADLTERLQSVMGAKAELDPEMLQPAPKRLILRRMLANLASIYRKEGDVLRSIAVLERLQILDPDDAKVAKQLDQLRKRAGELN